MNGICEADDDSDLSAFWAIDMTTPSFFYLSVQLVTILNPVLFLLVQFTFG
jgi:hypothetical protein